MMRRDCSVRKESESLTLFMPYSEIRRRVAKRIWTHGLLTPIKKTLAADWLHFDKNRLWLKVRDVCFSSFVPEGFSKGVLI